MIGYGAAQTRREHREERLWVVPVEGLVVRPFPGDRQSADAVRRAPPLQVCTQRVGALLYGESHAVQLARLRVQTQPGERRKVTMQTHTKMAFFWPSGRDWHDSASKCTDMRAFAPRRRGRRAMNTRCRGIAKKNACIVSRKREAARSHEHVWMAQSGASLLGQHKCDAEGNRSAR
eukprot:4188422-Pleurochrysis_carterae.AAC.3